MGHEHNLNSKCYLRNGSDFIASHIKDGLATYKIYVASKHLLYVLRSFKISSLNKLNPPNQSVTACGVFPHKVIYDVLAKKLHIYEYSKMSYFSSRGKYIKMEYLFLPYFP
jgi:hypothetical protein